MKAKKELGAFGEKAAAEYLIKNKYKIMDKNYKTRLGEIDIIAKDKNDIVFIEVKTRTNTKYGLPCEAVDFRKQHVICNVASLYILNKNLKRYNFRFDVVEVIVSNDKVSSINHIKNAFEGIGL